MAHCLPRDTAPSDSSEQSSHFFLILLDSRSDTPILILREIPREVLRQNQEITGAFVISHSILLKGLVKNWSLDYQISIFAKVGR
ncbi:hypothetical protein DSECCO2_339250 [anaerobic digester metagenome]